MNDFNLQLAVEEAKRKGIELSTFDADAIAAVVPNKEALIAALMKDLFANKVEREAKLLRRTAKKCGASDEDAMSIVAAFYEGVSTLSHAEGSV